jgi:hypothetical protein
VLFRSVKSTLNCALFNAHSICNKLCDLDEFLTHDKPDIVFITESWLTPDITNNMLDRHCAYDIYRRDRSGKTGGGVVVLCRRSLQSCQIAIDNKFSEIEAINIQLTCRNNVYNFINIYRPPGINLQSKLLMSTITAFLRHTCTNKFTNIVVGDFNLRLINWSTGECPDEDIHLPFYDTVTELGPIQFVPECTRNDSLLDLVLCDDPLIVSNISVECPFSTSDHDSIVFQLLLPATEPVRPCGCFNSFYYDFKNADYESILNSLANVNWDELIDNCSDVNSAWCTFINQINAAVDDYVPRKPRRNIPINIGSIIQNILSD